MVAAVLTSQVAGAWLEFVLRKPILLQLSSYIMQNGAPPTPPALRLRDRIAKSSQDWNVLENTSLLIPGAEYAIGETLDENGLLWIHAYIVWPHLTVYVTISGPEDVVRTSPNWAQVAMESMRVRVQ
jgi:hypothetical protein